MKNIAYWAVLTLVALPIVNTVIAVNAAADDEDIYVSPLDEDGSDETLSEEASSGFDTEGSFYIDGDDYYSGTSDDGTWDPDIPEVSPPEEVTEEDE